MEQNSAMSILKKGWNKGEYKERQKEENKTGQVNRSLFI